MVREYNLPKLFAAADPVMVARYVGIPIRKMGKKYSILCPKHDDHHYGSCFLTKSGFRCYACGESGGILDMVSLYCGLQRQEALDLIADACGNSPEFLKTAEEAFDSKYKKAENRVEVLSDEKLGLIGLMPSNTPLKAYCAYVRSSDPNTKDGWVEWFPDDSEEGWYGLTTKVIDPSPLRTLAREDPKGYRDLICQKAQEAIETYQDMISSAVGAHQDFRTPYIQKLVKEFGVANFVQACRENIEAVKEILIDHGGEIKKDQHMFGKLKTATRP